MSLSVKFNMEDLDILNNEINAIKENIKINEKLIEINKNIAELINNWKPIKKYYQKKN